MQHLLTNAGALALPSAAIPEREKAKACIGSPWDDLVTLSEHFALPSLKLLIRASNLMVIAFRVVSTIWFPSVVCAALSCDWYII